MPEEEGYNNLISLNKGEVDVKTLVKRYNVRNVTPNQRLSEQLMDE